MTKQTAHH